MKINLVDTEKIVFGDIKENPRGGDACGILYGSRAFNIDIYGYITDLQDNKLILALNKNQIKAMIELEDFLENENKRDGFEYIRLLHQDPDNDKNKYIMLKLQNYEIVTEQNQNDKLPKDKTIIDFVGCKSYYNIDIPSYTLDTLVDCDVYTNINIRGICFINNKYTPVISIKNIKAITTYSSTTIENIEDEPVSTEEQLYRISIVPDDI